jgi:hypothetical protein
MRLIEALNAAFNSLSRDHRRRRDLPQPPERIKPFNSLSRDHPFALFQEFQLVRAKKPLSTPSLGITGIAVLPRCSLRRVLSTPSLGITRDHGSHVHLRFVPAANSLSTPSLGITEVAIVWAIG